MIYRKEKISYRNLKSIKNDELVSLVTDNFTSLCDSDELDVNVYSGTFNTALLNTINTLAPLKEKEVIVRPQVLWIDDNIRKAKSVRRKAEDIWRKTEKTESVENRVEKRKLYKAECKIVKNLFKNARSSYFTSKVDQCNGNQRKLFGIVNNVLARKQTYLPDCESLQQLANDFSTFFSEKIQKICDSFPPSNVNSVHGTSSDLNRVVPSLTIFESVTESQVLKIIMNAPKTCCSLDPIPTNLLIDNLDFFLPHITHLVNISLSTGVFPELFKTAHVKPLLKKSTLDPNVLKNYRPVSNLPYISKVLERVVAKQLQQHMDTNDLNNPLQSAYRAHHSCETALLKVQNDLMLALDDNSVVIHVMLDLSAAFDTLDHTILLDRLKSLIGLSDLALEWFKSYLSDRKQHIFLGTDSVSAEKSLNIGVPQGSVLGPILFNIYTIPLYYICQRFNNQAGFYADDSQLYIVCKLDDVGPAMSRIEECVCSINDWMTHNRLKLNGDKTELTIFRSSFISRSTPSFPPIVISDSLIESQLCCRNLGSFFDSSLSMDIHVQNICKSSYFHLKNISSMRHYLDLKTTESLIHAFISNKIDYCNSLLSGVNKQHIDKLQKVQNRAARLCLKVSRRERHSSISLLRRLHWLPISYRIDFKILLMTFKCLHGLAPKYLSDCLQTLPSSRLRRSMYQNLLVIPRARTKTYGDRAFSVAAPRLWNNLPVTIRSCDTLSSFKSSLKTHLCDEAFNC